VALWHQSWITVTDTVWPTKPQIFTIGPFTDNVRQALCYRNYWLTVSLRNDSTKWNLIIFKEVVAILRHNLVLKEEKKLPCLSFLIPIQIPKQMLQINASPWGKGSHSLYDVFTIRFLKLFFFWLSLKGELFHIIYLTFIGEYMSDSFVDYRACCSG